MTTIAVSELRANLMEVIEEIKRGGKIQITSRGEIVAQLVPPDEARESAKKTLQNLRETAIVGDVLAPIDEEWNAVSP
ncbi:MAG TPA: type II toxin-antitoxin system prevent-host-death family antitoxin [Candidatus Marinimicrobia bacterium]|nr:MAG: prevent-host-death family protein [Candidatus Marinimicrobia bacterium CG1_02_48_14]PIZ66562.1 MAG: type II toxin-antitoxin system prevent-host-death family antitoxin [Candidatus Marinimicrobia bacterium CG_4_10_14_0_2_um_filter_48_9]PJA51978.1 MAG: type II toxin-antitoxin system prevent-host-death family antitoxin [Candidatus Marinimicrobia bacterium CG_4_9_14_3_um_filter_48_9]HCW76151.1 type II toxin-antitoxin system prevent-host-death family antitoxin [Candidatus Neomarinimicrobiota b